MTGVLESRIQALEEGQAGETRRGCHLLECLELCLGMDEEPTSSRDGSGLKGGQGRVTL